MRTLLTACALVPLARKEEVNCESNSEHASKEEVLLEQEEGLSEEAL